MTSPVTAGRYPRRMETRLPLFEDDPKVVNFAVYRAAHPREPRPPISVADQTPRVVTARAAAHRSLMLRHLAAQARLQKVQASAPIGPNPLRFFVARRSH